MNTTSFLSGLAALGLNVNPVIGFLIQAGVTYGPEAVTAIIGLFKNSNATIADVENVFANLKPYSAYNIPNLPGTTTTTIVTTPTP